METLTTIEKNRKRTEILKKLEEVQVDIEKNRKRTEILKKLEEVQVDIGKDAKISEDARKDIATIKGPFLSRRTIQIGLVTLLGIGSSTLGVMKVRDAHQNKTAREKMEKYLSEVDATNQVKGGTEKIYQATNENWLTNLQASTIGLTNEVKPTNTVELAPKVTPSPEPAPKVATVETNAINPPPILTVVTNATPSPKSINVAKIRAEIERKLNKKSLETQKAYSNELAKTRSAFSNDLAQTRNAFSNDLAKIRAERATPTIAPKTLEETLMGIRVKIANREELTADEKAIFRKDVRKKIVTKQKLTDIETRGLLEEIGGEIVGGRRLTNEVDAIFYNNEAIKRSNKRTIGSETPTPPQKDTAPTPPQHKQKKDK